MQQTWWWPATRSSFTPAPTSGSTATASPAAAASAPIEFLADPGVLVNHVPSSGLPNDSLADINIEASGDYYVIQGFTLQGAGTGRGCIRVTGSNYTQVLNNVASGGFIGIYASNTQGLLIQGNTCSNSTDQHGIYVAGSQGYTVRGNTLFGNNWDGLHMNVLNGQLGDTNTNALIENNVIYSNTLAGMDIEGISNSVFRNNVIYSNGKHGITIHSADQTNTPPAKNNLFINNTIVNNAMFAIQIKPEDVQGETILNNILFSASSTYGSIGVSGNPTGLVSDYNVVMDNFSTNLGTSHITLAQWQSQTGQDQHSIVSTPTAVFVNAGANDFHLKAGSPAVDAGTATSAPLTDITGLARPQGNGIDIGAYELPQ